MILEKCCFSEFGIYSVNNGLPLKGRVRERERRREGGVRRETEIRAVLRED